MGIEQTGMGGTKFPTWAIILFLIVFAVCIAKASKMDPIPIQGITPTPSATSTK
jgi:hypothetical protein